MENETIQQLTQQIAQLQQQLEEVKQQTAPAPKKPRDYFILKFFGLFVGMIAGFALLLFLWACLWPLDNDDDYYRASKNAHDTMAELRTYNAFNGTNFPTAECDGGCVVCHPFTWRFHVRLIRDGW